MNKPVYLSLSILEISITLIYEFLYDYIKPKNQNNAKLCYMNTDSFLINTGVEDTDIEIFCCSYNLTSMVNKATCYKNPDKPTCIDLILTNCPGSFQNSCVVETGLSDFHKMVVTVMKTSYRKSQPKIIHYRNYKNFSNDIFRDSLQKIFPQNLGNSCNQNVDDI